MTPINYSPAVETFADDEADTVAEIGRVMMTLAERVRDKHGTAMKGTHAKAVGLVKGKLIVEADLPPELAQGLFAQPGEFEALVRYAPGPPEKLSDKASGQRGLSIKVLGVRGAHIAESEETTTQDFVLAVDPTFVAPNAKSFLATFRVTGAQSPRVPEAGIIIGSHIARGVEAVLETIGLESGNLKFFGRPPRHPVSDPYYSQAPIRFGDHVAKVGVFPSDATLAIVGDRRIDTADDEAFRHATQAYFGAHEAVYDVKVQLCTDLESMPIEDATVDWPTEKSPYRKVATLVLPAQAAYTDARRAYFDDRLSFNPVHALDAHRPLGSIMRARMIVYKQTAAFREANNGTTRSEPRSFADVPD